MTVSLLGERKKPSGLLIIIISCSSVSLYSIFLEFYGLVTSLSGGL